MDLLDVRLIRALGLEAELGAGQAVTMANLAAVSPLLAAFHRDWPEWRAAEGSRTP